MYGYICIYSLLKKYFNQFVFYKKILKYINMYDIKIDIYVFVRNYYFDVVRGVKCIKEIGKIMLLDIFIL